MKSAHNKWVLITGAAQRIGRAIALEMAAAGWNIIVHYNTSQSEALDTVKQIETLGQEACLAELDLSDLACVKKLFPALTAGLGPISALINNASLFLPDRIEPNFAVHMTINAEAPRILSEEFKKQVPSDGTGAIINILDADPTAKDFSFYNVSKKALRTMTMEMAKRFAPTTRVNGIALGPVLKTPRQSDEHFRKLVQKTPLKKTITPEDVASTTRFLIENPTITGAIVPVDGGLHLKNENA